MSPGIAIHLNAAIVAVTDEVPRILTVGRSDHAPAEDSAGVDAGKVSLPYGPLHADHDRTLELGVRAWVREQTGMDLGYVEQLYTFGDRHRDPAEAGGGPRIVSVAYLALVKEGTVSGTGEARWQDVYRFLPWEDWQEGRPAVLEPIRSSLEAWASGGADRAARRERRERIDITFGLGGAAWDGYRVLERYELLYEVGLVEEARRDGTAHPDVASRTLGHPMALDHRRILATALGRMRGKLKFRPVVFELLPPTFTLLHLQRVVEALTGVRLHKPNFRRLVERGGLVEGTSQVESHTGGRPAELFRFRREVLRERPAPGVSLPGLRSGE